jgi:membrane protein implicated in regulation of membrane protease activity
MDWLRDHMWETWLGIAIVLGVAEMLGMEFFLLMLAVGALAGMGTAIVTDSIVVQVLVASAASVLLIAGVRPPLVKRLHGGPELVLGAASLVGSRGLVVESMAAPNPGRVKRGGENWLAISPGAESDIEAGRTVEVVEIVGATAHVRPVYDSSS